MRIIWGLPSLLALCVITYNMAYAETDIEPHGILSIARLAGACDTLGSMADFQKKTQLEGGNEFLARFRSVEAARMGVAEEELSNQCNFAYTYYDMLWEDAGKD